jgi:GT2 family glycosyltransferase
MTGGDLRVSIETPRGVPAEGGALEWVMASVTPPEGFVAAEVRVDGAVVPHVARRLADQIAISAWCDTRGRPPGLHEIAVTGRWDEGGVASDVRLYLTSMGERVALTAPAAGAPERVEVARIGDPDLAERLARTAIGGAPLVLLDDDCTLAAGALARITAVFDGPGEVDVVIGDEASMISASRWVRWRKRAFQPEALPSIDGVGPLLAVGPRAADVLCDALPPVAGLYGLALELLDRRMATVALTQVLTLTSEPRVPADDPAAHAAITALAARRGRRVTIRPGRVEGLREVRWPLDDPPGVAVVIPSRSPDLVRRCLAGIAEVTDHPALSVVVMDSSPDEAEMEAALEESPVEATRERYPEGEPFNYQRAVNLGADATGEELVLFLNDDVVPLKPDWLTRMVELVTLPGVGIAGALLRFPDSTLQHAGVQIGEGFGHRYADAPGDARGHRFELLYPGNPEAVTGACMLVRREVLDQLGGHDEDFVHVYGDVDLCFRATEHGWRTVWCAGAELQHDESASYGARVSEADVELFKQRWQRHRDVSPSARVLA